jgi:hypothetical protein
MKLWSEFTIIVHLALFGVLLALQPTENYFASVVKSIIKVVIDSQSLVVK